MVIDGKEIDENSLELDRVGDDVNDFNVAVTYAKFTDGTELNPRQTQELEQKYDAELYDMLYNK
jgi:hypothetical protein